MKIHTTNYFNTFILIADDCPVALGEIPPVKEHAKTVANIQFEMLKNNPYQFTSDEVLFQIFADKNDLVASDYKVASEQFFSKGQPCFRASPLTKRYGWGIHYDQDGKMAIYSAASAEYERFSKDSTLKILKAMRSSK